MDTTVESPPRDEITEELNRVYMEEESFLDPALLSLQVLSLDEWLAESESDSAG
ncbi:MAG: hypothetical protein ACJ75H_20245 [Thermoanaerobaculia bacterium]